MSRRHVSHNDFSGRRFEMRARLPHRALHYNIGQVIQKTISTRWLTLLLTAVVVVVAAGCGSTTATNSTSVDGPVATNPDANYPSAATANSWSAKYASITVGMPRTEVNGLMGTNPTASHPDQDSWSAFQYDYTVFYDSYGKVTQKQDNAANMRQYERVMQCIAKTNSPNCIETK